MNWMEGIPIQMTALIAMEVIKTEAGLFIGKTEAFLIDDKLG